MRQKMTTINAWIEAMRLRTLPVSVSGVLAGWSCALISGSFKWLPAVICLVFAIIAQIASNFANEYYDFVKGIDKKGREGFRRGVTEGDISPEAMKYATFSLLAFDALIGCSLIYWGGWWMIPVGISIAIFALAYSAGPFPLSHNGLGDIAVIIFFGLVPVFFTSYLMTGFQPQTLNLTLIVGLAIGMLADNVLIVNNYRDMEDDLNVGKRTTVGIFGRRAMGMVYLIFALGAITMLYFVTYSDNLFLNSIWILPAIIYIDMWHKIVNSRGNQLNKYLKFTAITLLFVSCCLLLISIIDY